MACPKQIIQFSLMFTIICSFLLAIAAFAAGSVSFYHHMKEKKISIITFYAFFLIDSWWFLRSNTKSTISMLCLLCMESYTVCSSKFKRRFKGS